MYSATLTIVCSKIAHNQPQSDLSSNFIYHIGTQRMGRAINPCTQCALCTHCLPTIAPLSICFTELIESAMYLYRATQDPYFLEVGRDMLESIEHSARTPCGYATVSSTTILFFTFTCPLAPRWRIGPLNCVPLISVCSSQIEYKLSCGRYKGLLIESVLIMSSRFLSHTLINYQA